MVKLRKSDVEAQLRESIRLLSPYLNAHNLPLFILTMLFVSRARLTTPGLSEGRLFPRRHARFYDDLVHICADLEAEHPALRGALLPGLNAAVLPDAVLEDFEEVIERFSLEHSEAFVKPERFSETFALTLDLLATRSTKRGVAYYTPRGLVRLLVELAKPTPRMSIYDPTAGSASLLIEAARYSQRQSGATGYPRVSGREKHPAIWALARQNLAAHGLDAAALDLGDALDTDQAAVGLFDLVLQALPVGEDGKTSRREEEAFLRHALAALAPQGRAVILSPSYLIQNQHHDLWQYILNRDWLEAVISLPPLLQGTTAGAVILLFNKLKPSPRREHLLFVDATADQGSTRRQQLSAADIDRVLNAVNQWTNLPGFARVTPLDEIRAQALSLNAVRYMEWADTSPASSVETALERLRVATRQRADAMERLLTELEALRYPISKRRQR